MYLGLHDFSKVSWMSRYVFILIVIQCSSIDSSSWWDSVILQKGVDVCLELLFNKAWQSRDTELEPRVLDKLCRSVELTVDQKHILFALAKSLPQYHQSLNIIMLNKRSDAQYGQSYKTSMLSVDKEAEQAVIDIVFEDEVFFNDWEGLSNIRRQSVLGGGKLVPNDILVGCMSGFTVVETTAHKVPLEDLQPKQVNEEVQQIRVGL